MESRMPLSLSSDMVQHQEVLGIYARKALVHGETLEKHEVIDQALRMREFMTTGTALGFTAKELVELSFQRLFLDRWGCGCSTCTIWEFVTERVADSKKDSFPPSPHRNVD